MNFPAFPSTIHLWYSKYSSSSLFSRTRTRYFFSVFCSRRSVVYETSIMENEDPSQIIQIHAKDRDEGENASLHYEIVAGNDEGYFVIDSNGTITSKVPLDREYKADYRLVVEARDAGRSSLAKEAVVVISILDEDDNVPRFSRLFHQEIPEDAAIGTVVLPISASDLDGQENHTFFLENHEDVFEINSSSGEIRLKEQLDRERTPSYRLKVRVEDGSWSVHTTAKITVSDVNDNSPKFDQEEYIFVANNLTVGKLFATDADSDQNGLVNYGILRDSPEITVDTVTGELRLLQKPINTVLQVTVVAHDFGIPSRSRQVHVTVLWEPSLEKRSMVPIIVPQNATEGSTVGKMDIDPNTTYTMVSRFFSMNKDGWIVQTGNFSSYSNPGWILARPFNGSIYLLPIEVMVADEDIVLQFEADRTNITVVETMPILSEVLKLNASCENAHLNNAIQYFSNDENGPFEVHRDGTIYLTGDIDYERKTSYSFEVMAKLGLQNATTLVSIRILDENDNAPILEHRNTAYALRSLDDVICLPLVDFDSAPYNTIEYSTSSDSVTVNPETGCISFQSKPDSELYVTANNLDIFRVTSEITILSMLGFDPPVTKNTTLEISENAVEGSILYSGISSVFAANTMTETIEGNEVKKKGKKKLKKKTIQLYAKNRFSRKASRFSLSLHPLPLAPSPIFEEPSFHFNITSSTKNVHDFNLSLPSDCSMEIEPIAEVFCISFDSALVVCGPLQKKLYNLEIQIVCRNHTISHASVHITVVPDQSPSFFPRFGIARENGQPINIFKIEENQKGDSYSFHIANDQVRKFFSITEDGVLSSMTSFDREQRSIYRIPISAKSEKYGTRENFDVRVIIDDVVDSAQLDSQDVTVIVGSSSVIGTVHPADLDSSAQYECVPIKKAGIMVSSGCLLSVREARNQSIPMKYIKNGTTVDYTVLLQQFDISTEQKKNVVQFDFYAPKVGVAQFLGEFQNGYPDLNIFPIAIQSTEPFSYSLLLSVSDHRGTVLSPSDSLPVLKSFLSKSAPSYLDVVSTSIDFCSEITCKEGFRCKTDVVFDKSERFDFRSARHLFNVPRGKIHARCVCEGVECSLNCDCPMGKCNQFGECERVECAQTCRRGICSPSDVCVCEPGYAGDDCSLAVNSTVTQLQDTVPSETCESFDCGGGKCVISNGERKCHCDQGFTSAFCGYASTVVSLGKGHVTLQPTPWLNSILAIGQELDAQDICNGSQRIEIDFRIENENGRLLTFDYGHSFAAIEISHSSLSFRVSDGYRSPIEIALGQIVTDGEWHTLVLELSKDRKTITLQIDGIGKEARSKITLPQLISVDLLKIHVGWDGHNERFAGCVRKLLINNQLQLLEVGNRMDSQYFSTSFVGDLTTGCGGAAPLQLRPGAIAAAISITVLLLSVIVIYGIWRMVLRNKKKSETAWTKAKEIDAFSMPKTCHINHGMTSSIPSLRNTEIYETADAYEMPLAKSNYRNQSIGSLPTASPADRRSHLANRPLPPSPLNLNSSMDSNVSSNRAPSLAHQRQSAYRNEAFF